MTDPAAPRPIGVFDSGVGGLTVARALRERLPAESILYLGDTARVPYGNRGADTIRRYALNAAHTLMEQDIKALVIACNTATAHGLDALTQAFPTLPIIGVVEPVSHQAVARTQTRHLAIIGTRATITSGCYTRALDALAGDLHLTSIPCPLLVPLAEEGWLDGPVAREVARTYLAPLADTDVDTLILGCTHYPLLRPTIASVLDSIMPRHVALLDCARATAHATADALALHGLLAPASAESSDRQKIRFLVTDEPRGFMGTAVRFFGGALSPPEHIDIIPRTSLPSP